MTPPRITIAIELERLGPDIGIECADSELDRLLLWLEHHPELVDVVDLAQEIRQNLRDDEGQAA